MGSLLAGGGLRNGKLVSMAEEEWEACCFQGQGNGERIKTNRLAMWRKKLLMEFLIDVPKLEL